MQPNPLRDSQGRPRDAFILPRNRKVPKSWPPPGWQVPADELAFLKEGEAEREQFAEAAQQAIEKLGELFWVSQVCLGFSEQACLEEVKASGNSLQKRRSKQLRN